MTLALIGLASLDINMQKDFVRRNTAHFGTCTAFPVKFVDNVVILVRASLPGQEMPLTCRRYLMGKAVDGANGDPPLKTKVPFLWNITIKRHLSTGPSPPSIPIKKEPIQNYRSLAIAS